MVIGPEELRVLRAGIACARASELWHEARYEGGGQVRDTLVTAKKNQGVVALQAEACLAEIELLEAVRAYDEWLEHTTARNTPVPGEPTGTPQTEF